MEIGNFDMNGLLAGFILFAFLRRSGEFPEAAGWVLATLSWLWESVGCLNSRWHHCHHFGFLGRGDCRRRVAVFK